MKLLFIITHEEDGKKLKDKLLKKGYSLTSYSGEGGFLRKKNTTLMIGVEDKKVEAVLKIIRVCCQPREEFISAAPPTTEPDELVLAKDSVPIKVGGASVFVLPVDRLEKI